MLKDLRICMESCETILKQRVFYYKNDERFLEERVALFLKLYKDQLINLCLKFRIVFQPEKHETHAHTRILRGIMTQNACISWTSIRRRPEVTEQDLHAVKLSASFAARPTHLQCSAPTVMQSPDKCPAAYHALLKPARWLILRRKLPAWVGGASDVPSRSIRHVVREVAGLANPSSDGLWRFIMRTQEPYPSCLGWI